MVVSGNGFRVVEAMDEADLAVAPLLKVTPEVWVAMLALEASNATETADPAIMNSSFVRAICETPSILLLILFKRTHEILESVLQLPHCHLKLFVSSIQTTLYHGTEGNYIRC